MSAEIGPGTVLICLVSRHPTDMPKAFHIFKGAIYICAEVIPGDECEEPCNYDGCTGPGITLKDKPVEFEEDGELWQYFYCPNLFRPLNDGDTSLVENELDQTLENADAPLELV